MPGMHRLEFEQGRVLLTLFIGDVRDGLRQQPFHADSIFLEGFGPQRDPALWELHAIKAVARHSRRGTTLASWTSASTVRRDLAQCGFVVQKANGLLPLSHCITAVFAPLWEPRGQRPINVAKAGHCVVIGAGLAGAAVASSLARRGWQVTVLDRASAPATGASGVPVAMIAPHFSPDDNPLSRLSRSGVRATLQQARMLLREGDDWQSTGVLEHRVGEPDLTVDTPEAAKPWTRDATKEQKDLARLPGDVHAFWHEHAGWIKPAALIRAWLAQPGVVWRGDTNVSGIVRDDKTWVLTDPGDRELARAELVVVAAACDSQSLLGGRLALQPVRGQVSWGVEPEGDRLPPFAVNGSGHFISSVPVDQSTAWFCGSTFGRGETDLMPREIDQRFNFERLQALLPAAALQLASTFTQGSANAWTGVRCASNDRRPLLGEIEPSLWVSTAMGSRGLTFAVLCAELMAAQLHGEPLPLERRLAAAIGLDRALPDSAR